VDRLIGTAAVGLLVSPKQKSIRTPCKILFIRPGGIGDAVLLTPAINALKKAFSASSIDVLAEKRNSTVFSLATGIRRVLHYDRPSELLSALRESYDLVIDTEQWHRLSAAVARLTRAPMTIGYATNERKKLFTHAIEYSHDDYEINSFLNLLTPLVDSATEPEVPFLTIPENLTIKVRSVLSPLSSRTIIAIFPGGSIDERKWGSDRFYLTAKLLSKHGYGIAVVGGKDDAGAGKEIIRGLPSSVNLSGKLSLPETAAVLQQSQLLITDDSGIMHIGSGLGIKIVALFGPGREKKWAPRGRNCIVINKHLPCSPCTTFGYTPKCKKKALCMRAITVEEVYEAALSLLNDSKRH
jgi:ADP-heptose:LPS heptosyltransferase